MIFCQYLLSKPPKELINLIVNTEYVISIRINLYQVKNQIQQLCRLFYLYMLRKYFCCVIVDKK